MSRCNVKEKLLIISRKETWYKTKPPPWKWRRLFTNPSMSAAKLTDEILNMLNCY
jgi:hypothetical protein